MEVNNSDSAICPKCGGRLVIVLYGDVVSTDKLKKVERGEAVLGGCCDCVDDFGRPKNPKWSCSKCGAGFGEHAT